MTYKVDTCRFVARCLALLGGKDWLTQCQDNVTGISGHGADGVVSQWGSTIESQLVHIVTS